MTDEGKVIQPKSVAIHTGNFSEFLQRQLGAIDFNQAWNNFFSQMEACIKLIEQIQIASQSRIITDPRTNKSIHKKSLIDTVKHPELILDPTAIHQFLQIWNGGCLITKQRDPHNPTHFINGAERFHYDSSKLDRQDRFQEVIPLPALDNMMPTESTMAEVWGIKISESVPFRYAFDECIYDTVIRDGKFHFSQGGKIIAKFQPSDMKSLNKKTYRVGKPYYYKTMKILKDKAISEWSIIEIDIHRIINFFENGLDEDEEYQIQKSNTTKDNDRH